MESTEKPLFYGSHLKVKRANKHINELNDFTNAFGKVGGYRMTVKRNQNRDWLISIRLLEEVSDDISLIVGDVIHNLRAAFDLAAHEMVKLFNGKPNCHTKFPFEKTRPKEVAALEGGVIQGLPLGVIAGIITAIDPYQGRDDPLYALHAMDIADKHHTLIQTRSVATMIVNTTSNTGRMGYLLAATGEPGDVGEVTVPHNAEIEDYGEPMLHVSFDKVKGFENQSIIPTLHQFSHLVTKMLGAIADECLAQKK